jgi:hypothetical protein
MGDRPDGFLKAHAEEEAAEQGLEVAAILFDSGLSGLGEGAAEEPVSPWRSGWNG